MSFTRCAFIVLLCLATALPGSRARAQSAVDGFDPNVTGLVYALARQADGKILVGGSFTHVSGMPRTNLARLTVDGVLDTNFTAQADGVVYALAVQPDGKTVVGGNFTRLAGQTRHSLGRLNGDGTPDGTFQTNMQGQPEVDGLVRALALQEDGKIIVGGAFFTVGAAPRQNLARLETNGAVDLNFHAPADDYVRSLAVQRDGKIVVGGYFTGLSGETRLGIGRLNADGTLDGGFLPQLVGRDYFFPVVFALALQPDGKVVAGGNFFTTDGPDYRECLARFHADGRLDTNYLGDVYGTVSALAQQPDGRLMAGGTFNEEFVFFPNLMRMNADGSPDASYSGNASSSVSALLLQPDGKMVVGGAFLGLSGQTRSRLGRLYGDGRIDGTFDPPLGDDAFGMALQPGGEILVGRFQYLPPYTNTFSRLRPDGTADTNFNASCNDHVSCVAVQADGKVLFGGSFTTVRGQPRNRIARLNRDGTLDGSFNPGASATVQCLAIDAEGRILVSGQFTNLGGLTRTRIGRLLANGSVDPSFQPLVAGICDDCAPGINSLAVQTDGRIVVGGGFTMLNGQPRASLGRLNDDGSLDGSFNAAASAGVSALALQPDGKILVGGYFHTMNGHPAAGFARLHANGSLDTNFTDQVQITHIEPGAVALRSLALQTDGKIIVCGQLTGAGGLPRTNLARLNPDGSVDGSFRADTRLLPWGLALQTDGKLLVGGDLELINNVPVSDVARLTSGGPAGESLTCSADGSTVTWQRSGTGPEVGTVTFERSGDGTNYVALGQGTRIDGGWKLGGLSLPAGQNIYLRARGRTSGGIYNGSSGLVESIAQCWRLPPPFLSNVQVLGGGAFAFSFTNTNAVAFTVLASTNVALPVAQWEMLGSAMSVGGGVYQFTDPNAVDHARRFYRLVEP